MKRLGYVVSDVIPGAPLLDTKKFKSSNQTKLDFRLSDRPFANKALLKNLVIAQN